jgi:protease-4
MAFNRTRGALRRFWGFVDASRRFTFNLLFLFIVVVLVVAWFKSGPAPLQAKTALVIDPHGTISEQRTGNFRQSAFEQLSNEKAQKVQLRDLLLSIDAAADDPKIARIVLALDELGPTGPATLHEIAAALDRFRAKGKQIVAWGAGYDQRQYYLASHADEVWMHPDGMLIVEGYGGYHTYFKDALDKLGVSVHVARVGTFKSAVEPFIANQASPAAREADAYLYNGLWSDWLADVEKARKLKAGSFMQIVDQLPQRLSGAQGDLARLALDEKLVDGLKTRDEMRKLLTERGAADEVNKTFRQISFDEYLGSVHPKATGDAVGVVIAEGAIVDGVAPAGTIGGLSTAALIKKARDDEHIKAVVLRVNSPGGSSFGSELVRRELELTRAAGKPVVVSMGDLAASGGYWITMAADEVIADRSTITGSIGVFGLFPTAEKTMDKLGLHTDGVGTTWLAGADDPRRPLDPRMQQVLQLSVEHAYSEFTHKAAAARKTTPERIDAVAQGRVWTGTQAKERGLVDRIGSYRDALDAAASRAKLDQPYRVTYVEREPSAFARAVELFSTRIAAWLAPRVEIRIGDVPAPVAAEAARELAGLVELLQHNKPYATLVHCLCTAP